MSSETPEKDRARPRMPRYQPLVIVLIAAIVGIVVDRFWPLSLTAWWSMAAGGLAAWLIVWTACRVPLLGKSSAGAKPVVAWHCLFQAVAHNGSGIASNLALLIAIAATAAAWHHDRWFLFSEDDLGRYARAKAQPVCVEVVAAGSPRTLAERSPDPMQPIPKNEIVSRLDVQLVSLRNGAVWQPVSGRARLAIHGEPPNIAAGDRLRVFARFSSPLPPQNPGAFDHAAWLRAEGSLCRLTAEVPECIATVQPGTLLSVARLLDQTRNAGNRILEDRLHPACAEVAEAVLLGEREQLDGDRIEAYVATGIIHLLVISGSNLAIVAGVMFWSVRRLPLSRGWAAGVVAATIFFYMLLVDAGPPVERATVLVLAFCAAGYLGRQVLSFNALAGAALVVLALNPSSLFHTGAQLSFLAVVGLIVFVPHWTTTGRTDPLDLLVNRNLTWHEQMRRGAWRSTRHLTLVSLAIWLLVLPLVMARFHLVTPVAILLNTLVWIPMTLALLSGFALLLVGAWLPPLAYLLGGFCNLNLWLLEGCVTVARRIPGGHIWVPGPADWWLAGFYGGLGLLLAFPRIVPALRWRFAILSAWILIGFAPVLWRHNHRELDCTFLSVGHGCAALVELPSGQAMLYDAGRMGDPAATARTISDFLWSRGRVHLDAVVLSHPDIDHYNALPRLLDRFSVGAVYVTPVMFEKQNAAVVALHDAIVRHGVPIRELRAGDRLQGGEGCVEEVLHPPPRGVIGSDNANSLVLAVKYRGRTILLTGDLEPPGLNDLLSEEPVPCDVLLAPHHGSRKSNSPALAAWCRPRWVVFSGDGRWSVPEAESPYRAIGGQVFCTSELGAISVRMTPNGVDVAGFTSPR